MPSNVPYTCWHLCVALISEPNFIYGRAQIRDWSIQSRVWQLARWKVARWDDFFILNVKGRLVTPDSISNFFDWPNLNESGPGQLQEKSRHLAVGKSERSCGISGLRIPFKTTRIEFGSQFMCMTYVVHRDERTQFRTNGTSIEVLSATYRIITTSFGPFLWESTFAWLWKSYQGRPAVSKYHLQGSL